MTRRVLLIATIVAASGTVGLSQAGSGGQGVVFRTRIDAVPVEVSVRSGGTPVGGLTARDFVLLDNGVRQQIEVVDPEEVPLDVSLLIDTSGSTAPFVEQLKADMRKIAALLRPDDRLRLLTIDTSVNEIFPMQPAARHPAIDRMTVSGLTSLYDALAASMLRPVGANRRHIVIAMTDGVDTISALDARAFREVARRSEATLHIAHVNPGGASNLAAFQCRLMGLCSLSQRFWIPFQDHDPAVLADAARLTGGDLYEPGLFSGGPVSIFKQILDDFRRSYVLRYMPRNVAPTGWHELKVRVPAAPSYWICARSGYAIGVTGPPPGGADSAPVWAATARPLATAIESVVGLYDRGDYNAAADALRRLPNPAQFIRDFRAVGNPWPANPRREAALVIEIAEAALYRHDVAARDEALALLESYNRLVRNPLGADSFERLWYWAELTTVEGLIRPELARPFVVNALKRCPDEPRFVLAQAIISDQTTPLGTPDGVVAEEAMGLYDAAMRFAITASEAQLRKAYLLHRRGRHEDAVALLDTMRARETDQILVYFSQLLRGHFNDALGHVDQAANAYRAALVTWPNAQAPRVGLMALLFRNGDRIAAERMADSIQTAAADAFDPWWQYWQADYRSYPAAMSALREAAR